MRTRVLTAALLLALSTPGFAQEVVEEESPFSFSVGVVSDYAFRGVSQTNEGPAIQVGADYAHPSGFHIGTWASNVDFVDGDGANIEWDLYAGWGTDINDTLSFDVTFNHYFYLDQNAYEYNELLFTLGVGEYLSFLVGYSDDVFGTDETGIYYQASGTYPLPWGELSLIGSVGHYDLDDAYGDSYQDASLGLSKAFGPMTVDVSYVHASDDVDWGDNGGSRTILSAVWAF